MKSVVAALMVLAVVAGSLYIGRMNSAARSSTDLSGVGVNVGVAADATLRVLSQTGTDVAAGPRTPDADPNSATGPLRYRPTLDPASVSKREKSGGSDIVCPGKDPCGP